MKPIRSLDVSAWRNVAARVDQFFSQVVAGHPEKLACGLGCAACCHPDLTLTFVEAAVVGLAIEGLPAIEQQNLQKAAGRDSGHCPLLVDNACSIYASRPTVCRSHGLPIRQGDLVSSCDLNFDDGFPEGTVLNAELLSSWLMVADGLARLESS